MAENFEEAAERAYADACLLHGQAGSPPASGKLGTPDHLFGLAAECALKAILRGLGVLTVAPGQRPQPARFAVHVDKLWGEYLASISGRAAYAVHPADPFSAWAVAHRYEEHAFFTGARVEAHRDGAAEAMRVLEVARLDGVLE